MHIFLDKPSVKICNKCGKEALPHRVCLNCGHYKNKEVINVFEKLNRKEKKIKEKEIRDSESGKKNDLTMEELSKK